MSKKRVEEEEEKENGERWLLTYSDLITLLLAFFIILYTMSNIDLAKYKELSGNLNSAFNGGGKGTTAGTGTGDGTGDSSDDAGDVSSEIAIGEGNYIVTTISPLDEIYNELNDYIKTNNLEDEIELKSTDSYILISLKEVLLFIPDSPVMLEGSKPALSEIEGALKKVYDKVDRISISGHTADVGKGSTTFEWKLSTDRAITVLNYMTTQGLPDYKLSIEGHSHFDPVASNDTEAGKAQNRRVEITIFKASVTNTSSVNSSSQAVTSSSASGQ